MVWFAPLETTCLRPQLAVKTVHHPINGEAGTQFLSHTKRNVRWALRDDGAGDNARPAGFGALFVHLKFAPVAIAACTPISRTQMSKKAPTGDRWAS